MVYSHQDFFFWQPKKDYLRWLLSSSSGHRLILFFNYALWPFLFFICWIHIYHNANIFWQILTSIIITEVIERIAKHSFFWKRPLYVRCDQLPSGLVKKWYVGGSFPSGHMVRASYFFLLILQYGIFSPLAFIFYTVPLMFFRIIIGFHYPIDLIGGAIIGFLVWFFTHGLVFPPSLIFLIRSIFDIVFFVHR